MVNKTALGRETKKLSSLGWRVPPKHKFEIAKLSHTSLPTSITVAAGNWGIIWLNILAAHFLQPSWLVVLYLAQLLLVARALRAFENLVHEASHRNWHRRSQKINDFFANWMCAYWVGLSTEAFRTTHLRHHADFGSEVDPCTPRYRDLGLDSLDRRARWQFVTRLFSHIFTYTRGYWRAYITERRQLAIQVFLHLVTMMVGSLALWRTFWILWAAYVIVAFVFVLPFLRLWAEASKHRYTGADPELESTYNNIGKLDRYLIHPCGDGYHLLHHYLPSIPHHRLPKAHRLLSSCDPRYRVHPKVRWTIFDEPDRS